MQEEIRKHIEDGIQAVKQLQQPESCQFIEQAAICLANAFDEGKKVIVAGNGGSLCDAMHFAEELTGQFCKPRKALPAIVLGDPGHLTCVANDMGFENVFSRGVEAYGQSGDVFVGLTTSGNSPNIIKAFEMAASRGLKTIAFLGKGGGKLKGVADFELIINGFETSDRVQEAHMTAIHILIGMVERKLFYQQPTLMGV